MSVRTTNHTLSDLQFNRNIIIQIGKAIKQGKYLNISYENLKGELTNFWICIHDVNSKGELFVDMFNITKDEPILNSKISINRIKSADILRFSSYNVSEGLIHKLNYDKELDIYQFQSYDARLLEYYLECYRANSDPFLYKTHLIPEIDSNSLSESTEYQLSDIQQEQIIREIYLDDYPQNKDYELALSEFSIDIKGSGKFVVAYRKLRFDPVAKALYREDDITFNPNFYIKNRKYTLSYYTEMSQKDFQQSFLTNKLDTLSFLEKSFNQGELINTRPEIIVLGYSQADISRIYNNINGDFVNKKMALPLKAFFQKFTYLDTKNRTKPNIVLYDNNVNIDQLRTIYNAHKYPITYVQGPPGTGKTQTILNILVNSFTSNKTTLVSSNNNVPIDGIYEKLDLGTYKGKEIMFPILRLGNDTYLLKAMEKIRSWYEFETKDVPREDLLSRLKENSKARNKELDRKLESIEIRYELKQNLDFIECLLVDKYNHLLIKERDIISAKLKENPEVDESEILGIFDVIKDNYALEQYFYFESLKHVKRLKQKNLKPLIDIIYIDDEKVKIRKFSKWLYEDENLESLLKVFPIILTTNLSSRKLGAQYKFDLLVIDEAGQCDIATSLIPISKCQNMVMIGDTNQLQPIMTFEEHLHHRLAKELDVSKDYDYLRNSILSTYKKIDNISRNILLTYHYRCGKKIINYSNQRFYENKLNLNKIQRIGEIQLLNVSNKNNAGKNSNIEEATAIVEYVKKNQLNDVFILTPFRNQKKLVDMMLEKENERGLIDSSVKCGTIHQVQGQENNTIILSTSISKYSNKRSFDWIKNNSQLINVGVTRAKEKLVVVADKEAIDIFSRKDDDLYALIEYVARNGSVKIAESNVNKFTIGLSNDSEFENEFYKTMQHYCSVKGSRYVRNVNLVSLFPQYLQDDKYNKMEFDGVLYENNIPKVVFELNGADHYYKKRRLESDKLKIELLNSKGIKLMVIPNHYVKHYEFVTNLIGRINGGVYQQSLFGY